MPENAEAEHVLYCVARDADWLLAYAHRMLDDPALVEAIKDVKLKLIETESYIRMRQSTRRIA